MYKRQARARTRPARAVRDEAGRYRPRHGGRARGLCLTADLLPRQYDGAHLADALISAMPQGGAALLLRAAQGGRLLPEKLAAAGVRVTDVPLYDTVYRCEKADAIRALLEPVSYTHLDVYKRQT